MGINPSIKDLKFENETIGKEIKLIAKEDGGKDKKRIDSKSGFEKLCSLFLANQGKLSTNDVSCFNMLINGYKEQYGVGDCFEFSQGAPATGETQREIGGGMEENTPVATPTEPPKKEENKPIDKSPKPDKPSKKEDKPVDKKPEPDEPSKAEEEKNTSSRISVDDNSGVVVKGDNNTVTVTINAADKTEAPEEAAAGVDNAEVNKKKMLEESTLNYQKAFAEGEQVAKDLIGRTNDKQKANAIRLMMKQSEATIMGFISGFNDNDTVMGIKYGKGGLLDQVDNEYGWTESEKNATFSKIISTVLSWAEKAGYKDNPHSRELRILMRDVKNFQKIDTEKADKHIKELISLGKMDAKI